MIIEKVLCYSGHRKRNIILGTFGMISLGLIIGLIASSRVQSAHDKKVLKVPIDMKDDDQVQILYKFKFYFLPTSGQQQN